MTTRRRAREIVLQLLYEDDLHPEQDTTVADQFLVRRLMGNRPLVEFARNLFQNVMANRKQIDQALSDRAANWSLRRMAAIDRNVLRLGAYEILMTQTPGRVVINEAVELAKRYGDRQSGQFVNGILDRVLHGTVEELEEKTKTDPDAEPAIEPDDDGASDSSAISSASTPATPPLRRLKPKVATAASRE